MNMSARRLGAVLLGVASAALLSAFAAASPAAADNGPHIAISGNYQLGSGPEKCAGCHRLHSAKGEDYVLAGAASGEAFCEACHDGTGATTNTKDGYSTASTAGTNLALRAGGFAKALMDSSNSIQANKYLSGTSYRLNKFGNTSATYKDASGTVRKGSIPTLADGTATTSTHSMGTQTMWGSGLSTKGDTVELECTSCHNPHGNGNYRILQNMGTIYAPGATTNLAVSNADLTANVTAITPTTDAKNTGKYLFKLTVDATHKFVPGQQVTVMTSGTTPTTYVSAGIVIAVVNNAAPYSITVAGQSLGSLTANQSNAVTAYVRPAFPTTIVKAVASGTTYTYTTSTAHGLYAGQVVTISTPSGVSSDFALTEATIVSVPTTTSFTAVGTVSGPTSVGIEGKLFIVGIPDAKPVSDTLSEATGVAAGVAGYKKVYTTPDYFFADDHYYSGAYQNTDSWTDNTGTAKTFTGLANGYIVNISQWCATCHTRYIAGSGQNRKFTNSINGVDDANFTYRHNTAYGSEGSYNCVQCHVAHGSNAAMTGYAADLKNPDGTTNTSGETSRLLRVSNRAICLLCHALAD